MIALMSLFIGFAVAAWTRDKPWRAVQVSILLWLLVPAAVVAVSAGATLDSNTFLHPSTAILFLTFLVQVTTRGDQVLQASSRYRVPLAIVWFGVLWSFVTCIAYGTGYSLVLNQLAAPVVAFSLIGLCSHLSPSSTMAVVKTVVWGSAAVAGFAILGTLQDFTSPFTEQMRATYLWFDSSVAVTRQSSTLDGPLVLAFAGTVALPLIGSQRRVVPKVALASLAIFANLASQSRTGVALCAIGVLLLIFQRRSAFRTRIAASILIAIAYAATTRYGLASGVTSRFQYDNGSAGARSVAWSNFFDNLSSYSPYGMGPGADARLAQSLGMPTSFESALACLTISFGILFGIAYFGGQILIFISAFRSKAFVPISGAATSAAFALISVQTFSSTANQSAVSLLQWIVLGLMAFGAGTTTSPSPTTSATTHDINPANAIPSTNRLVP
ncbi:hypothetical protein [Aeromicrobium sp. Root472D3]|uniref:hypothetical protein n=1 Tax=Aeromicrobium sp. Root472D3 TaxID=1736540 RepID=UPI0006FB660C|nr:hypothetical protein [Aeromicrobium sp. Root472D3]KQX74269.1 hypothetical protein ASD10_03205 [Aeromicrobium sp. Root472D3]